MNMTEIMAKVNTTYEIRIQDATIGAFDDEHIDELLAVFDSNIMIYHVDRDIENWRGINGYAERNECALIISNGLSMKVTENLVRYGERPVIERQPDGTYRQLVLDVENDLISLHKI